MTTGNADPQLLFTAPLPHRRILHRAPIHHLSTSTPHLGHLMMGMEPEIT
jgi:hypothetical protein